MERGGVGFYFGFRRMKGGFWVGLVVEWRAMMVWKMVELGR